jgi:hypothetical protein
LSLPMTSIPITWYNHHHAGKYEKSYSVTHCVWVKYNTLYSPFNVCSLFRLRHWKTSLICVVEIHCSTWGPYRILWGTDEVVKIKIYAKQYYCTQSLCNLIFHLKPNVYSWMYLGLSCFQPLFNGISVLFFINL